MVIERKAGGEEKGSEKGGKGRRPCGGECSWAEGRKKRASLGRRDESGGTNGSLMSEGKRVEQGAMPEGETREPPPGVRGEGRRVAEGERIDGRSRGGGWRGGG